MDPRISFSNDFADTQQAIKHESSYREAPVSSDFEFSVDNFGMISADEIIFKGTLLPLKDNSANNQLGNKTTTLRDELLADDEDYGDLLPRATNSLNRWKERLGLKRAQIVQKNGDRGHSVLERIAEERRPVFVHEAVLISKESQEFLFGGFNCRDDGI
ncbi:hypothetical protein ACFX2I_003216 [Malus domestica]|uniref:uncharacterized protein LOC126584681 n=1 Tax=Malus sylvestris TaxID=3752 RepID=UPI0021AD20FA|nr:uncharacterized protein LOC126584681 [Malus sylvestris]